MLIFLLFLVLLVGPTRPSKLRFQPNVWADQIFQFQIVPSFPTAYCLQLSWDLMTCWFNNIQLRLRSSRVQEEFWAEKIKIESSNFPRNDKGPEKIILEPIKFWIVLLIPSNTKDGKNLKAAYHTLVSKQLYNYELI